MKLAYDRELKRPACVLLQAALGCGPYIGNRFHPATWLLTLTPGMRVYEVTEEQLEKIIQFSVKEERHEQGT